MDIESKDPKGNGTLLHVIKRASKDWVSFLKESIEFAFKPLNHLIAIGPKLEKDLTHQSFVLRVNDHLLIKMINMFHWIRPTIINGEGQLMKSPKETRTLYPSCERGLSDLI